MLEAAQPTTDEVVLEPEEEVRKTAAPENEMPEVIVLPAEKERSDQDLGLKRKHCVEDAPNLDTSTLENSDLLRKVENLENEIEELKKCQNKEGMPSKGLATLVELEKNVEQLLPQQESGLEANSF
ncbi:hypothetical protein HPB52_018224 [Rhipicephalus sanguineus]|uniref:Uncharacterized protein n=1 Tax=Rhipicephalus sanguineus TaxID=34632 RepID=A0A9D4PG89_RHISA|nr:hypothetical protein HPB52_018224 [Rhipicephalus sanguineus]